MSEPKLFAPAPSVAAIVRELLESYPHDLAKDLGEVVIFAWFQDHEKVIKGRDVAAYVRKHGVFERSLLAAYITSGDLAHAAYMSESRSFTELLLGLQEEQGTLDLPLPDRPRYIGMDPCVGLFVVEERWVQLTDFQRRALIDHELRHITVTLGRDGFSPRLIGHDLEEFRGTVRRYGYWHEGVKQFVESAESAGASHRRAGGD